MTGTVILPHGLPKHIGPGSMIDGKYRLEAQIGRGSMGTVFSAVHVTLGQRVAIKLISLEHSHSLEARQRFATEAKAAARLRSRHVVQVYDDGETPEGNPYIVLELLEGETVEQRVERERDVPLVDATRIVSHVARALARAHAQGIVHRDLKPANVFLVRSEDEEAGFIAKVLDFGIAKLSGPSDNRTTQAGALLGTPLFMSPEQVLGASFVDHRADLYSLGMCLYYMLTGELAFYSPSHSDILVAICTQPLPSIRAKAPWVPEAVDHWFQRACAREPLQRFQSADEMAEALRAAGGALLLSKHQSVPDGRIAPETLMGLHPPPGFSPDAASRGQTLKLPPAISAAATTTSPGYGSPHGGAASAPLEPMPVANTPRRTREADSVPQRSPLPLMFAVAFALLVLASAAFALLVFRSSPSAGTPAGAAALPKATNPTSTVTTRIAPPTAVTTAPDATSRIPPVVSSVAGAARASHEESASPPVRSPLPRPAAPSAPAAKRPAAPPSSSDLGF